jgi:3-phosphoshikimate 1-carboxyvinyltransferase
MLVAKIRKRIEINLVGEIIVPYIKMTLALLNDLDVKKLWGNVIKVYPKATVDPKEMTVESDWVPLLTFSLVALSETAAITLSSYKETSLQGDSALVKSIQMELKLILKEIKWLWLKLMILNLMLISNLIIHQIFTNYCCHLSCLGIGCHLTGLHTY